MEDLDNDGIPETRTCYGDRTLDDDHSRFSNGGCEYNMRDRPGMNLAVYLEALIRLGGRVGARPPWKLRFTSQMTFGHRVTDCNGHVKLAEEFDLGECNIEFTMGLSGIPTRK